MSEVDDRTVNLMQTLLKSGDVVENFEKIIEECKAKKVKYVDNDFYPQKNISEQDKTILEEHEWKRIEEQYPNLFDNIAPGGVRQGKLGDCYFIASLIYVAHNKELVKYLFHPKSSLELGCVLIYFHFLGERIPVIVDTLIPYPSADSKYVSTEPMFSRPKTNDDSCWFVLVEKAFAKACGGYFFIESGQTHFGNRVLLDQFPVALGEFIEIIQEKTINDNRKIDLNSEIFNELLKLQKKNAMIGTSVSASSFIDATAEEIEKSTGLITEHAYQILDIRDVEKKKFIKVRNPWGRFEWTGPYSNDSEEWTEKLKKELDYSSTGDGSFWMTNDDFLAYFKSAVYSLPKEKGWKEHNVFGKIEGYLDGRSPCNNSKYIGCLPQWSIKFTKKTVVRLSYDVAGPSTFHGLYICKAHGKKIDSLDKEIEIKRTTTNTTTNGIEYIVNDFSEPYTFFLYRPEIEKQPCYYRLLIESPDEGFKVEKFNDNFVSEKWNNVSDKGMFTSPHNDQWDPFTATIKRPLTTCRQWYLRFPDLKKNEEAELRIQLFKNVTEKSSLDIFIAKTTQKVSYAFTNLRYRHLSACAISDYEEFSVAIDNKDAENDEPNQWAFCVYRNKSNEVSQFKFVLWSKKKIEFGLLPEPDPLKNCGYTISGKIQPSKMDGASPYEDGVKNMMQWCLVFKKSPTIIFIEFSVKKSTTAHCVYLEKRDSAGQKMDQFFKGSVHFDFDVQEGCDRDRIMWKIEDSSKPYALCVCREKSEDVSEYCISVFSENDFEMNEIDGDKIGKSASKYKLKENQKVESFNFPQIKLIDQPLNFRPKKTEKPKQNDDKKQKSNDQKDKPAVIHVQNHDDSNKKTENQQQNNKDENSKGSKKSQSKCCLLL